MGLSTALPYLVAAFLLLISVRLWKAQVNRRLEEQFAAQHGCKPVKPWSSSWIFGLDLLVKAFQYARSKQILRFFLDVVDESGVTFEQNLLGARGIDTIDPENIEAILSKQFNEFGLGLRPLHFYPLLGSGIFTQDGPEWKHSREMLRPEFSKNRIENFDQMKDCVENLISCIPADGLLDLQPLFFRLTFDTTTYLLFGKSMSALSSADTAGEESKFANAFNTGQDYLSHRGRLGDFYWLMNDRAFKNACRTCHDFVDQAVKTALQNATTKETKDADVKNYVFIDALIEETKDPKVLRDQALNVLLAGRDTTACCLTWAFRLLARNQRVFDRLRSEIEDIVGLGPSAPQPSRNDLKKMTYLNSVIKEVLRLYPSVPVNSRAALKMTTLPTGGGEDGKSPILVRKGEAVGYCVYAMHRRTDLYGQDAHEFRPERWENDALKDIGWGYLPFNGGPRICLGQDFAMQEAAYTIARILQLYTKLRIPDGEVDVPLGHERQTLTLVVSSGDGCKVVLSN